MTGKISKAYAELTGGGYDEGSENVREFSLKEIEVRVSTMERVLRVLAKYKETGVPKANGNTPIQSRMQELESEFAGNIDAVLFYLVRQNQITLETAMKLKSLPKAEKIDRVLNYMKADED